MAQFYEILYKKNDIIRNIKTGKPYLVIHIYKHTAVLVVDLTEKSIPRTPMIILPSDFSSFSADHAMVQNIQNGKDKWEYSPLFL